MELLIENFLFLCFVITSNKKVELNFQKIIINKQQQNQ